MFLYYFYALVTAPGVVMHELGHAVFCVLSGVKIHQFVPFRFGNPAGYVVHDEPKKLYEAILVSFGPLIINSLTALWCFASWNGSTAPWHEPGRVWLGVATGLHAIPSSGDMKSLFSTINGRFWRNPFVILGYPFVLVLFILNILKRLHIHFVYTAFLWWLARYYFKA